jgi:subtilisin family serine protease
VVHAVAPEAELLFANWEPGDPEQFLEAVRWARRQGAQVLSCSVIMPSWSDGDGGGPVHEALARILGGGEAGDLLFFASAGNVAQRHWSGSFHDGGDGFHEWAPGQKDNVLTPWGDERVSVEVCWRPGADYDLRVYDNETGAEVARSLARAGAARSSAVAGFKPEPDHTYTLRVRLAGGTPGRFHCFALGSDLQYAAAAGSICFPGDGPEVLAVGAVDGAGRRLSYSACGPSASGPKPDLVAAVPFVSLWREAPFGGTSAAAPQAAGLAALWWSCHPDWAADRVRVALRTSVLDLSTPGPDSETGYGLVRMPSPPLAQPGPAPTRLHPATPPRGSLRRAAQVLQRRRV